MSLHLESSILSENFPDLTKILVYHLYNEEFFVLAENMGPWNEDNMALSVTS